jgi:hypothetical protein
MPAAARLFERRSNSEKHAADAVAFRCEAAAEWLREQGAQ